MKKKGRKGKGKEREREGEREGEGKEKGKRRKKKRKEEYKFANEGGKNMRGKEMKKINKGTNAKELRNCGISLIIHNRRLSGLYSYIVLVQGWQKRSV